MRWLLAPALLVVVGCSHSRTAPVARLAPSGPPSPVGYWTYKTVILQPVGDPSHKKKTKKELQQEAENRAATRLEKDMYANLSLEFRSDGTYTLDEIVPVDGTWSQDGTKITMDADKMLHLDADQIRQAGMDGSGTPIDDGFSQKEATALIGKNGKKLTYMANDGRAEVVLVPGQKPSSAPPPKGKSGSELERDPF